MHAGDAPGLSEAGEPAEFQMGVGWTDAPTAIREPPRRVSLVAGASPDARVLAVSFPPHGSAEQVPKL